MDQQEIFDRVVDGQFVFDDQQLLRKAVEEGVAERFGELLESYDGKTEQEIESNLIVLRAAASKLLAKLKRSTEDVGDEGDEPVTRRPRFKHMLLSVAALAVATFFTGHYFFGRTAENVVQTEPEGPEAGAETTTSDASYQNDEPAEVVNNQAPTEDWKQKYEALKVEYDRLRTEEKTVLSAVDSVRVLRQLREDDKKVFQQFKVSGNALKDALELITKNPELWALLPVETQALIIEKVRINNEADAEVGKLRKENPAIQQTEPTPTGEAPPAAPQNPPNA